MTKQNLIDSLKIGKDGKDVIVNKGGAILVNTCGITEDELDQLNKGGVTSVLLNFAILGFSVGFSFLATILTASFESDRLFGIFFFTMILGFFSGIVLITLWRKIKDPQKSTYEKLKARLLIQKRTN